MGLDVMCLVPSDMIAKTPELTWVELMRKGEEVQPPQESVQWAEIQGHRINLSPWPAASRAHDAAYQRE